MSLALACKGKSASSGGLNVIDLKRVATKNGIKGASKMKRDQLLAHLCGSVRRPASGVGAYRRTSTGTGGEARAGSDRRKGASKRKASKSPPKIGSSYSKRSRRDIARGRHDIYYPVTAPGAEGRKLRHVN